MNDATPNSSLQAAVAPDSGTTPDVPLPDEIYVSSLFSNQPDSSTSATSITFSQAFKRKRIELLDAFLRQFDTLLFIQFSILYYYDSSFLNFLLRAGVQAVFLTPRSIPLPDTPFQRPYIGSIIGANLFCLISHTLRPRPEAGEITEGYLHGGILIDFVGEKGPIWRSRLLVMDLMVLALQLIMLAAVVEKLSAKASTSAQTAQAIGQGQDHDAEERGVLRAGEGQPNDPDTVIAQPGTNITTASNVHTLDPYYRGDSVLAELDVLGTVRRQWRVWQDATAQTVTTSQATTGARNEMTTLFGGILGVRLRVRGRTIGL